MDASHKTSCHRNQSKCWGRERPAPPPPPPPTPSVSACYSLTRKSSSTVRSFSARNVQLIDRNSTWLRFPIRKKEAFDKYIDGFFKTYAPERRDKYWLCSVLRRASRRSLIRQSVFWSQGIDRGRKTHQFGCSSISTKRETPSPAALVISSHHNNISARPCAPKWIFNGQEVEGGGGWGWLPCSQSIALLQLRNPAGRCHSYFIPGKDYLSGPWEMYWSVFLFPPAITWQRHLGGKWVSDAWCVCSAMVASSVHWWV